MASGRQGKKASKKKTRRKKKRAAKGRKAAARTSPEKPSGRARKGGRAQARHGLLRRAWRLLRWPLLVALVAFAVYVAILDRRISSQFEGRRWQVPARVYAQPLDLHAGRALSADALRSHLDALGYRRVGGAPEPGQYSWSGGRVDLHSRAFDFWDGEQGAQAARVRFDRRGVAAIETPDGAPLPILRLDPRMIGSIVPASGEDRIVLADDQVPSLLRAALIAVEDRDFERHHGIDLSAIARAAWVNLRAGAVRQGGSTLTQQLVKSYFLDNRRTLGRKAREALMAVLLDARYGKDALLTGYVNEIYLGQDGARAVHGFGLASQYYFGQPLAELDVAQLALLVAIVRGPSYYDPRRHPERARARRDLVLDLLVQQGEISAEAGRRAQAAPLAIVDAPRARANYAYPAFLDAVRAQLRRDYEREDLSSTGLQILTTLDTQVQARAQAIAARELAHVERDIGQGADTLEIGVVISDPDSGEVLALIGGRRASYAGFNRAVSIRRPLGSLVKPFVYLGAIESRGYDLATVISNAPLRVPVPGGREWSPQNYSDQETGDVPLYRALAESVNRPAVHTGLDVGVARVARVFERVGLGEDIEPYPSILLGALDVAPIQVAQAYTTLAAGGVRTPLRTVRAVLDERGRPLQRFGLSVDRVAGEAAAAQINAALGVVMQHGTGRGAAGIVPAHLAVVGKSGTSSDYRDAWFAGYSGDRLAVVWVGRDDNAPIGASGARAALPIWAELMAGLATVGVQSVHSGELEAVLLDYASGMLGGTGCETTVLLPLPRAGKRPAPAPCAGAAPDDPDRGLRRWLRDTFGGG